VPVLSDPASLANDDLQKIEKHLFDRDSKQEDNPYVSTKLLEIIEKSMSPPMMSPRVRRESLKVEETLTPPDQPAGSKSVHFSDFVEEMRLDTPVPQSESSESRFFEEAFGDAARLAMSRAEQETLIEADTIARVVRSQNPISHKCRYCLTSCETILTLNILLSID
jgi:hypothetical protein